MKRKYFHEKKKRKYFHELSDSWLYKLRKRKEKLKYLFDHYRQPVWCDYPEAMGGVMGCWSLVDLFNLRHKISRNFCRDCDLYRKEGKEKR